MEDVKKLVEYRTAHYSAHSEAASYVTNTPAQVQFRFANPIICQLKSGFKRMSVDGNEAFDFWPGDVLYVPPGQEIDIDLGTASTEAPINCDCVEIESGRMDLLIARLNENLSAGGNDLVASLDWSAYVRCSGDEAEALGVQKVMSLFSGERDPLSDLLIETQVDEMLLSLMHNRARDLVRFEATSEHDNGVLAAARLIKENLHCHHSTEALSEVAVMSASTLHRQFQRHFGTTPSRFANQMRIARAKRDLRGGEEPIDGIAHQLGFSDVSHFTRVFRKSVGETPAKYRKRRKPQGQLAGLTK